MPVRPVTVPLFGLLIAGLLANAGVSNAQQSYVTVDEDRVVIPRARIIRVPGSETSETRNVSVQGNSEEANTGSETGGLETRPLEPISGSSSGGGLVPREDQVASNDPVAVVARPFADSEDPTGGARVRVISPARTQDGEQNPQQGDGSETDEQAAKPEDDNRPVWQRKRTRRFKLAPKGTDILDASRPTYAVPIAPLKTGLKQGARLRQLDKMTGQTITYDLAIGEERRVDRLLVSLDACRSPENNASRGAMAFLKIWDTRNIGGDPNFTGWMFAESPALSALDHPRYDLWVISCTTSDAEVSTVNE